MKKLLQWACAIGLALGVVGTAMAQSFSNTPIRIVVGFSAGGATDAIARLYGQKLSEILKTPVIVDNRPGANQITAIRNLMSSPADGRTLYLGTGSSLAQGPGMRSNLGYDPLKDFTLIALVASTPGVIVVSPDLPVKNVRELLAYSAAHPDSINYGSAGVGTANHLQTEYFMSVTGAKWTHVPFKSDADVVREVATGRLQVSISTTQQTMPLIQAGKLRALATTTLKPLKYLPGIPALPDTGVKGMEGLEPYTFYGLVAPAGLPPAQVARLNNAVNQISAMPEVVSHMSDQLFAEAATSTPASFRTFMEKEVAKWRDVGRTVKLPD